MKYFSENGETDAVRYARCDNDLTLLLETRVDYGIHHEGWDIDDCVKYFNAHGLWVTKSSFQRLYTLVVTDPCYFVKYGMGYVWTSNIMKTMKAQYPNATDKQIHTAYLNGLTGTYDQIEANMRKQLK